MTERLTLFNTQAHALRDGEQLPEQSVCKAWLSPTHPGTMIAHNAVNAGVYPDRTVLWRQREHMTRLLRSNPQLPSTCGLLLTDANVQVHYMVRAPTSGSTVFPFRWTGTPLVKLLTSDHRLTDDAWGWIVHWAYEVVELGRRQRVRFDVPELRCSLNIASVLGVGATSTVYRVETDPDDEGAKTAYALKLFNDTSEPVRAEREQDVLATLTAAGHRWVPSLVARVPSGFVMDLCQPVPLLTAHRFRQLMAALQQLHRAGYCHGDVGPANVAERDGHLVLLDFGSCLPIHVSGDNHGSGTAAAPDRGYHGTFFTASDAVLNTLAAGTTPVPTPADDVEAAMRTALMLSGDHDTVTRVLKVPVGDAAALRAEWKRHGGPVYDAAYAITRASHVDIDTMYSSVAELVCQVLVRCDA